MNVRKASLEAGGLALALITIAGSTKASKKEDPQPTVTTLRVPHGGIRPQMAADRQGTLHLVYFSGADAGKGDLFYVRSTDGGATFSEPLRVSSHPGSATAVGNIRGAHMALGKNGRVHVSWNGTYEVEVPGAKEPSMKRPMVYTRLNDAGSAFEPERNVIRAAYGLDGGGAIAADSSGGVYVFWHAPTPGLEGEENRRVWIARSLNDGQSFDSEKVAFNTPTGACGCCGMGAFADSRNNLYVLFRSAKEMVHRDIYLLSSTDRGRTFAGKDESPWNIGACVMSMQYLSESPGGVLAGWETMGNVFYGLINPSTMKMSVPVPAPGEATRRKYPVVLGNSRAEKRCLPGPKG